MPKAKDKDSRPFTAAEVDLIHARLQSLSLTQKELAHRTRMSSAYLSQLLGFKRKTGRTSAPLSRRRAVARALRLAQETFDSSDTKTPVTDLQRLTSVEWWGKVCELLDIIGPVCLLTGQVLDVDKAKKVRDAIAALGESVQTSTAQAILAEVLGKE